MVGKPTQAALHLSTGTLARLRPGEQVFVRVLQALGGGKWEVGIKGRVVPAASTLPLVAGQRLRAQVTVQHGRTVLRLQEGRADRLEELLRREGLPLDSEVRRIVDSLLRSGLQVRGEQVHQARRLLDRLRLDSRRFSRLSALALEKGIDLRSPGLEELLPILGYGDRDEGHGRYRGRRMPEGRQELEQELEETLLGSAESDPDTALPLFNHLRGKDGSWVVVPFHYTCGDGSHLYGTLRLLYDAAIKTSRRLVLVVRRTDRDEGTSRWSFVLDTDPRSEGGPSLRIYSDRRRSETAVKRQTRELQLKLRNLGVETDDTIRIDEGFDGFSPTEDTPYYRSIDLES